MYNIIGLFSLSTKESLVQSCFVRRASLSLMSLVSLVSSLVSVHTCPYHRVTQRNFAFGMRLHTCLVPTGTGKPEKNRKAFPSQGKVREFC